MILQDFIVKVKYDVIFKVDEFGQVISLKAFQLDTSLWFGLADTDCGVELQSSSLLNDC